MKTQVVGFIFLILISFTGVPHALAVCNSDAECGPCMGCVGNVCQAGPAVLCMEDIDCPVGQVCKVNPDNACLNMCIPVGGCQSDADCGQCQVCLGGVCVGNEGVMCFADGDCDAGYWCKVNAEDPCANSCIPDGGCNTDDDCGECKVCMGGECSGPGVACKSDGDCPFPKKCKINPDDVCNNMCTSGQGCVSSNDCGACQVCMDGECVDAGEVMCESDDDCMFGLVCKIDENNPCNNQCVQYKDCWENDDCGECKMCKSGSCTPSGPNQCKSDSDCPDDKVCQKNAEDPCQNTCVTGGVCDVDDDCGSCESCMGGECTPAGEIICADDGDCDGDMVCEIDVDDPCSSACVNPPPECEADDDCDGCMKCVNGECSGTGTVECTEDVHCGQDLVCHVDPDDQCANFCGEDVPECAVDDDCGPCEVCQDADCVNTGAVKCISDDDCEEGLVCDNDPDNPCVVTCVDPGASPDPEDITGEPEADAGEEPVNDAAVSADIAAQNDTDGSTGATGSGSGCSTGAPGSGWWLLLLLLGLAVLWEACKGRHMWASPHVGAYAPPTIAPQSSTKTMPTQATDRRAALWGNLRPRNPGPPA